MVGRPNRENTRNRGSIDELPSGALRVRVYAGVDPVTKRRHDLVRVVPPGPGAWREAERVRDRFVHDVAERRNPRTSATVDQLLARYLDQFDGAPKTLSNYRGYVRNHVSEFLGDVKVGEIDADILDSFYAELRRCRSHCKQRRTNHWTTREHKCDRRCGRPHICRPLGASTIRHIHFLLSGAFSRAVRWRWVSVSPISEALPPAAPKPNPQPPTPEEAARIVRGAWDDLDWGALIWTAMTTGARRGEICAVRWPSLTLDQGRETVWLRRAIRDENGVLVEAPLKTHQQRRVALDAETAEILRDHRARCVERAAALGLELAADSFVFSGAPDNSTFLRPDGVTQRYERLAARLGIATTIHKLRHFSATELIAAGVDPRTVAGRLGHSGGGTTTLKTYSAWVSEADQRAATGIRARMPQRPVVAVGVDRARTSPRHPYERVAAAVAGQIDAGVLSSGVVAPSAADLAVEHGVSLATAKRGLGLVQDWGLLRRTARDRLEVVGRASEEIRLDDLDAVTKLSTGGEQLLDLVLRHGADEIQRFSAMADPRKADHLRRLLAGAVRRSRSPEALADFELEVRLAGQPELLTTFVEY
ncbi:MAG: integrase [Pseudonocardiaceae bacterium]|nr:MAG: integrase [Pseudonocardiaceae bacterium]